MEKEGDDDDCPICYDKLSSSKIYKTTCKHTFHEECIRDWYKASATSVTDEGEIILAFDCPYCRRKQSRIKHILWFNWKQLITLFDFILLRFILSVILASLFFKKCLRIDPDEYKLLWTIGAIIITIVVVYKVNKEKLQKFTRCIIAILVCNFFIQKMFNAFINLK
jgi:hypothetical protein